MPGQFLTTAERERWERFPRDLSPEDLANFFTLSGSDRAQIPHRSAAANRLGFALQLCALRYLGFCPDDLATIPPPAVAYVAQQLAVDPGSLTDYGARAHTRTDHLQAILAYTGFRKAEAQTLRALLRWLTARALEHDRPTLLLQLACEKLRQDKVLRPGLSRLERLVITARHQARHETVRRLAPLLTDVHRVQLDALLIPDVALGRTRLAWLQHGAVTASPSTILATLDKLVWLHALGVGGWDLAGLTPNRRKFLAGIARRSTNQALQRMPAERRYPILAAFLHQSQVEVIDEAIDLFDRCLADTYARARHELEGFREVAARATNEKVYLFRELGRLVLDPTIQDEALRPAIYARIPPAVLRSAVDEADRIVRPLDDSYIDFLVSRYSYLRQFTPRFLEAFVFSSHTKFDPLLEALALLRALNATHRRTVPDDAPVDFVPATWHPYVIDREGHIDRHAYELCVLWELRGALRAGNVWLPASRRYADPETHLIPRDRWPTLRADVCRQMQTPEEPTMRLQERAHELEDRLVRVDALLARGAHLRMEDGALIVPRLEAEDRPVSVVELEQRIDARLPLIDLSELLAEVDEWTRFSRWFEHASGYEPPSRELLDHLYAALLAQGCNIGLTRMAQSSQTTYRQLAWCTTWYLREDTLKAATAALVNFHYHLPLSHLWGGGTLSSSDGQRFPVAGKVRNATALPRYFRYGKGISFSIPGPRISSLNTAPGSSPRPRGMRRTSSTKSSITRPSSPSSSTPRIRRASRRWCLALQEHTPENLR